MMLFLFLFSFSLFSEEVIINCDNTYYEKNVFYFSKGLTVEHEDKKLSANHAKLEYPLLTLDDQVFYHFANSKLSSDHASINLLSKSAEFFSHVVLQEKEISFSCKKAVLKEEKQLELFDDIEIVFDNTKIHSDKMQISSKEDRIFIMGSLKGILTSANTNFSYDGTLIYDKKKQLLETDNSPFFLNDENFSLMAKKAEFFLLKEKKGLERILFSGPVEITSENTKALSDTITYFPEKGTYILKSTEDHPVLLWQDGCLLSAREIHILQVKGKNPEIETKGIVHFSLAEQEKSRFKHLLKK